MTQIYANVGQVFDVQKEAFHPPPKVTSSIVRLIPKDERPPKHLIDQVRRITHHAFSQRRKMIKKSLAPISDDIIGILGKLNIDPSLRAENLSVEDYVRLAKMVV
jgi:16S rRNA (adenine1518-N6/adenine1519-N6)-dimethyltransferase